MYKIAPISLGQSTLIVFGSYGVKWRREIVHGEKVGNSGDDIKLMAMYFKKFMAMAIYF